MNINTICNEEVCNSNDYNSVNFYFKKYEILEFPPILSINTNANNFKNYYSIKILLIKYLKI